MLLLGPANMNTYPETFGHHSQSMENSRNSLRRIARNDDKEFSHQSILSVMEQFVKSVNSMDETILVPCRLMDLKVGDENDPTVDREKEKSKHTRKQQQAGGVQELLNATDLFQIYNMLNNVKDGLLWGGEPEASQEEEGAGKKPATTTTTTSAAAAATTTTTTATAAAAAKGHVRRPSTVSVASTISDTESEAGSSGNENDSGIDESTNRDFGGTGSTQKVASDFRRHLDGLTRSLKQMTETAQYLTWRYQHDIGGPA